MIIENVRNLVLSIAFLLFNLSFIVSQNSYPQISLLTCDSGDQLYSTFGHSAIRVYHPDHQIDQVYNYGTFNPNQSHFHFYLKFMRGKLMYSLSRSSYRGFLDEYFGEKRAVREQILVLDSLQKEKLLVGLKENYKKENRYYKYDFFFDNCSTRIRDLLAQQEGLTYNELDKHTKKTFRDLLDENLLKMPWSDFGIDLVIGAVADDYTTNKNQMFLPDYLHDHFDDAKIKNKKLTRDSYSVISFPEDRYKSSSISISPLKLFISLLLVFALMFLLAYDTNNRWKALIANTWIFCLSIICIIILFLWLFTDHLATKENWNLLWINPIILIVGLLKAKFKIYSYYLLIFCNMIALLAWNWIPQAYHLAFFPMILTNIIVFIYFIKKWNTVNA